MKLRLTILTFALVGFAGVPAFAKGSASSHSTTSTHRATTSGTGAKAAATTVHGYTKKDGTHVDTYKRTTVDGTQTNNFSATGNYNPYTGKVGTVAPKK